MRMHLTAACELAQPQRQVRHAPRPRPRCRMRRRQARSRRGDPLPRERCAVTSSHPPRQKAARRRAPCNQEEHRAPSGKSGSMRDAEISEVCMGLSCALKTHQMRAVSGLLLLASLGRMRCDLSISGSGRVPRVAGQYVNTETATPLHCIFPFNTW